MSLLQKLKKPEVNGLELIFAKNPKTWYELNEEGLVVVKEEQNRFIQKILRKIGLKIPQITTLTLDKYSSFAFLCVDGEKTALQIYKLMEEEFGDEIRPADRLLLLLSHLEKNAKYIYLVKPLDVK